MTLKGITPAPAVGFLTNRDDLLLPKEVLLLDKSDTDGTFTGFETDCDRREARVVAGSGRGPAPSCKVVWDRSRTIGRGTIRSVPVFAR